MENFEHFIFEQLTDMDKNIDVLARQKCDCMKLKERKICSQNECTACSTHKKFMPCYSQLSLCDQMKVDQIATATAAREMAASKMTSFRLKGQRVLFTTFLVLIFGVGTVAAVFAPGIISVFIVAYMIVMLFFLGLSYFCGG